MVFQPLLLCDSLPLLIGLTLPSLTDVPQLVHQVLHTIHQAHHIHHTSGTPHTRHTTYQAHHTPGTRHTRHTSILPFPLTPGGCTHVNSVMKLRLHHLLVTEALVQAIVIFLPLGDELLLVIRSTQICGKLFTEKR